VNTDLTRRANRHTKYTPGDIWMEPRCAPGPWLEDHTRRCPDVCPAPPPHCVALEPGTIVGALGLGWMGVPDGTPGHVLLVKAPAVFTCGREALIQWMGYPRQTLHAAARRFPLWAPFTAIVVSKDCA